MKVVFIHTDFRIYWQARIEALHLFLQSRNIELHVIEIAGAGSPYEFARQKKTSFLSWHILFPSTRMEVLQVRSIKKAIDEKLDELVPDVIFAGAIAFPSGALATAWAKRNQKRIVVFDDCRIDDVRRNKIINFIKQNIYNGVDAMLYPAIDWESTGKFWKFKEEQLFYGVDVVDNGFWQQDINKQSILVHGNYFLSVGRQIPRKFFMYLLQAYKIYKDKYQDRAYQLVLVGEGSERCKIASYIKENSLSEDVILYPFLQQSELITLYRNAEAFLLASIQETWGLVINEAMASGLPIIVSDKCGATKTLVKESVNGYTFSPMDEAELVDKLITFHSLSQKDKAKMKEGSLNIIRDWDLDRFCEAVYDAIQYVSTQQKRKLSILNSLIIDWWKGRYRPL